jgi:hypothetical protein
MAEQTNPSPQNVEDRVQNEQENCVDNMNIMVSIAATDPEAAVAVTKSQSSFPKGELMTTVAGESVSAFTDTNASDCKKNSLNAGSAPEQGYGSSGPPSTIIQQLDDDSAPLITFDSIQDSERESDASDSNGMMAKGDDSKSSWLNIDSSSTSQGSQGSYAHQVQALLGSYGSNGIDIDRQPNENLLPSQLPSPKKTISDQKTQSAHSRSSHFPNLEKPQNTLDDILGPNGEPLRSDLDDILGPQSDGKPSDLDDTLGPYEGSTIGPSGVPPSGQTAIGGNNVDYDSEYVHFRGTNEKDGHGAGTITNPFRVDEVVKKVTGAASISEKQKPQVQTDKTSSIQQLHHQSGSKDFFKLKSTWESKGTGHSQATKGSVDFTSESSHGDTIGQGDDDVTQGDDTLSPNNQSSMWDSSNGETFSHTSYSQTTGHTLSTDLSRSDGYTFSGSRRDSFSPRGDSLLSLESSGPSALNQGDSRSRIDQFSTEGSSQLSRTKHSQLSINEHASGTQYTSATSTRGTGSRSRIDQFSTEGSSQLSRTKHSQLSINEHTSGTQYTSATSTSGTGSRSRMNEFSAGDSARLSPSKHSQFSHTEHTTGTQIAICSSQFSHTEHTTNAICSIDGSEDANDSKGGRMWQEAQLQADSSKDRELSPRAKNFAESIMARTRSRADTNALLNNSSNIETIEKPTRSMINVHAQEESGFVESTAIARKRGRVVQLLTIGLVSFLIAFLGGFLVLSSCYFVSAAIQGENGEEYDLHFGLWKYSPAESASQGYTYCSNYDGDFIGDAPWFGRVSSLVALLGGGFSLGVLWLYLVLGRCVKHIWDIAVYAAAISGVLQLSTLSILAGTICNEQVCTLGPAGTISIAAACFYFVLAFEMRYNTPLVNLSNSLTRVSAREEPHHMMTNLEMTDFEYGAKAYVDRIVFGIGETMKDGKNTSYVPPNPIV